MSINKNFLDYLLLNSYSDADKNHSNYIINLFNINFKKLNPNTFFIDCHGWKKDDIIWLLDFIMIDSNFNNKKINFLIGKGNHSKKPQMDYLTLRDWKSPLYVFIKDYFINKNFGARMTLQSETIIFFKK